MFPNLIMQKKSVLPVLSILLINFVSAFSHYGYNRFSITGFFSSINPDDMILMTLFIIIFAFINFSLGKIFRDSYGNPNKATAGVVAFAVTSLIIYGFWRTGFNLSGLFYNVGISEDMLFFIIPIILIVAAIFIVSKIGWAALFLIFGLLMLLITIFTDLIYEKGTALIIGFVLFLIGLWLWWRKRRDSLGYGEGISATGRGIGRGLGATGRGAWGAAKWAGGKIKQKQIQRQQQRQQEQQRTQARQDIRHRTHDTINEIRRIDKELKSIPARIGAANKRGNQQQVMILEQERTRIKQQRRDLENEIRRLRREHSGNI